MSIKECEINLITFNCNREQDNYRINLITFNWNKEQDNYKIYTTTINKNNKWKATKNYADTKSCALETVNLARIIRIKLRNKIDSYLLEQDPNTCKVKKTPIKIGKHGTPR